MPSKAAHRAALRRSHQSPCIAPDELNPLPALPPGCGWLNPLLGQEYDRSRWHIIWVTPAQGVTVCAVYRSEGDFVAAAQCGSDAVLMARGDAHGVFNAAARRAFKIVCSSSSK